MLEKFLIENGMFSKITGHYSGRELSITVDKDSCLIMDVADEDFFKLYEGDHSGAIEYLSMWWDL